MVIENVRGAQPWVGQAKANFGSFYLWGDVGMVGNRVVGIRPQFGEGVAAAKRSKVPGKQGGSVKQPGQAGKRKNGKGSQWFDGPMQQSSSRSNSRKEASAAIAKIPFPLARHIARAYRPGF